MGDFEEVVLAVWVEVMGRRRDFGSVGGRMGLSIEVLARNATKVRWVGDGK